MTNLSWLTVIASGLAIGVPFAFPSEADAQVPTARMKLQRSAASSALTGIVATVRSSKNYGLLGLRSKEESEQVELGDSMRVREIGYDRLVAFKKGDKPERVFTETDQVIFYVRVKGQTRASMTFVHDGKDWRLTTYGDAGRTQAVEKTRAAVGGRLGASKMSDVSFSLVSVPAFNLYFLSFGKDGRGQMTLISPYAPPELKLEGDMTETEVMERLSAYAKAFEAEYGAEIRKRKLVK